MTHSFCEPEDVEVEYDCGHAVKLKRIQRGNFWIWEEPEPLCPICEVEEEL